MNDIMARFWAIMGGQCLGAIIIVVAGILPYLGYGTDLDEKERKNTKLGLKIVGIAFLLVLVILIFQFIRALPFLRALPVGDKITDNFVENIFWWLIAVDIAALLFVVCQQGGLSRSAFIPMFFLMPAAYLAVFTKYTNRYGIWILLISIVVCLSLSHLVSRKKMSELRFFSLRLNVTDFSTSHHKSYNWSFLIVSIVSLAIPALQFAFRAGYTTSSLPK